MAAGKCPPTKSQRSAPQRPRHHVHFLRDTENSCGWRARRVRGFETPPSVACTLLRYKKATATTKEPEDNYVETSVAKEAPYSPPPPPLPPAPSHLRKRKASRPNGASSETNVGNRTEFFSSLLLRAFNVCARNPTNASLRSRRRWWPAACTAEFTGFLADYVYVRERKHLLSEYSARVYPFKCRPPAAPQR